MIDRQSLSVAAAATQLAAVPQCTSVSSATSQCGLLHIVFLNMTWTALEMMGYVTPVPRLMAASKSSKTDLAFGSLQGTKFHSEMLFCGVLVNVRVLLYLSQKTQLIIPEKPSFGPNYIVGTTRGISGIISWCFG